MKPTVPAAPSPKPSLVATLPGRTAAEVKTDFRRASELGADLVEVRLDRMPSEEIAKLETIHQIPIEFEWVPAIATYRSRAEGGEGSDRESDRLTVLLRALDALPFTYVDLEIVRDLRIARELRSSYGRALRQLFSAHLPPDTPGASIERILEDALTIGDLGKVVLPASVDRAVSELIPIARKWKGRPYVLHTTGPSGPILRALAYRLGMRFVYTALPGGLRAPVEPTQLPLDRMRSFFDAGEDTPWLAVVGHPIAHSRSPLLHHRFLEEVKLPWLYLILDITTEEEFRTALPRLLSEGLAGLNITAPYKELAPALCEHREEEVVVSGSANTLTLRKGPPATLDAANTDVLALAQLLTEVEKTGWDGATLLVVGSGGTARAAIAAGVEHGAQVYVTGRNMENVARVVSDFPPEAVHSLPPTSLRPFPLIIHATPAGQVGAGPLEIPIMPALVKGGTLLDLVYAHSGTELRDMALRVGTTYISGEKVLVYQAAESFRRFTGRTPSTSLVETLLLAVVP